MDKKRVLIFPFNLLSHYLRCLVYADRFYSKDEYEVFFLYSKNYEKFIHQYGYQTFTCEQFDADQVMRCSEKFDFSWLNESDIERVFLSQREVIKSFSPILVLGDVAPTLKMAAEDSGVDYHAITNGYMTKYYVNSRKLSRTHKAYYFLKIFSSNISNSITRFAEKVSFKIIHHPFNQIRRKYGLKKITDYLTEMEGDENIICDLEVLFPQKHLPNNYCFIDPLLDTFGEIEEKWIEELSHDKPIIVICMGSTGNWNVLTFFNDIYFTKYTIITAGDKKRILDASHIISKDFINLTQVLKKADLMICHGGNGTIYFGLNEGVYMLCYTSHFEQEWNVHALERIGYGKSINEINIQEMKSVIAESLSIKKEPYIN